MPELHLQTCNPCNTGDQALSDTECSALLQEIPDWQLISRDGTKVLKKVFLFANWQGALDFTNQVGELAEEHGHHPELITEWGKVTVFWWTHAINGLHQADFIMAAKTDQLPR